MCPNAEDGVVEVVRREDERRGQRGRTRSRYVLEARAGGAAAGARGRCPSRPARYAKPRREPALRVGELVGDGGVASKNARERRLELGARVGLAPRRAEERAPSASLSKPPSACRRQWPSRSHPGRPDAICAARGRGARRGRRGVAGGAGERAVAAADAGGRAWAARRTPETTERARQRRAPRTPASPVSRREIGLDPPAAERRRRSGASSGSPSSTSSLDALSVGKIAGSSSAGPRRPCDESRAGVDHGERADRLALPREMSFARHLAVRLDEVLRPGASRPGPQFDVPVVMPKVWLPKMPFVVAARIWTAPGWFPKASEPRPQPAAPYRPGALQALAGGEGGRGGQTGRRGDREAHAFLLEVTAGSSPRRVVAMNRTAPGLGDVQPRPRWGGSPPTEPVRMIFVATICRTA